MRINKMGMNKTFKEAFDRALQTFGEFIYNQGYEQGSIDTVENGGGKEKYEQGLNDAWECAKKLRHMNYSMLYKVFDDDTVKHNIQIKGLEAIFEKYSASEAIQKLKEYEEKQKQTNDVIKIGDEIYSELTNTKAVIFHIDAWHRYECFVDSGSFMSLDEHTFSKYWIKTGKNYPQIAEVFKQLKEDKNGDIT